MRLPVLMTVAVLLSLLPLVGAGAGCGEPEPDPEKVKQAALDEAKATKAAAKANRPHPETEEALVEALSQAIEAQDFDRVRTYVAPELGADLHRLLGSSPGAQDQFWARGRELVANVKSGFTVAHRQEVTERNQWRVLLRFGNGKEETVVFTKVGKRLVFQDL